MKNREKDVPPIVRIDTPRIFPSTVSLVRGNWAEQKASTAQLSDAHFSIINQLANRRR